MRKQGRDAGKGGISERSEGSPLADSARTLPATANYWFIGGKRLRHQPFIFDDAVERDQRQNDGHLGDILLIFRTVAIIFVLAQFQTAGAAEHHPKNQNISPDCKEPLPKAF